MSSTRRDRGHDQRPGEADGHHQRGERPDADVAGTTARTARPTAIRVSPAQISVRGPNRSAMRAMNGVSAAPTSIIGRNTSPVGERRQPAELLQVEAHHERQPVVADDEREPDRDGDRHVPGPEQLERHHRVRHASLRHHEHPERDDRGDERDDHRWRGEAVGAGFDRPEGQARPSPRTAVHCPTQSNGATAAASGADPGGEQHQGDGADGHVDEEDQPPRRPGSTGRPAPAPDDDAMAPPIAHIADRPARRAGSGKAWPMQRHRRRHHHRGGGALHEPGHHQHAHARSEPAGHRGGDEHDEADAERPAGADPVADTRPADSSSAANISV